MVDLIKAVVFDNHTIESLNNNDLLIWSRSEDKLHFDKETIITNKTKVYKGIAFTFYKNKLEIVFKPHYYFNDNLHNANDFKIQNCIKTILEFQTAFNIDLEKLRVVNIEFGVNVIPPIEIEKLITWIKFHSKNQFFNHSGLRYSKQSQSISKTGKLSNYKIIKAYAKGIQYPQYSDLNTFRFEIKSKTSQYISDVLSVFTMDDLLHEEVYNFMGHQIISEFEKLLILDHSADVENLSKKEQKSIIKYLNVDEWEHYTNKSINVFRNNFNKFYEILDKTGLHLKNRLRLLVDEKINELKMCEVLTVIEEV